MSICDINYCNYENKRAIFKTNVNVIGVNVVGVNVVGVNVVGVNVVGVNVIGVNVVICHINNEANNH